MKRFSKGESVIAWLNNECSDHALWRGNTAMSRARLFALITRLQTAESFMFYRDGSCEEFIEDDEGNRYDAEQASEIHEQQIAGAMRLLRDYPLYYSVAVDPELREGHFPGDNLLMRAYTKGRRSQGEAFCVAEIKELVNTGLIEKVVRCVCGRFFFATRYDQRSCSAKCRHKIYEQTPEAQEKRRLYMQGYNRLKRSGKVK